MKKLVLVMGLVSFMFAGGLSRAKADMIDFETQGAGRGSAFTGTPDSPLVIAYAGGTVTFTGGELLNHTFDLPADQTAVYGAVSTFPGYMNPLVITFSTPISGFSILVLNGDSSPVAYTVSDNVGDSLTMTLAENFNSGSFVFSLPGTNITTVMITSAAPFGFFDFFIDNVTFTPSAIPEPGSLLLLGVGLVVGSLGWRRLGKRHLSRSVESDHSIESKTFGPEA